MNVSKVALSLVCLGVLSACETEPKTVLSPEFGTAVRHNMAVHIINPPDPSEPAQIPDYAGDRAARAYERMLMHPSSGAAKGTVTPMTPSGSGGAKP